ncbi:MAG: methionyl-tRNA formyltransferase [Patescibacteria group bacterium]|nr:methionyl-tRNA formyltransferase [Patescibacteria group bacterium]
MINFAFFGTDEFAVIILDELKKGGMVPTTIISVPDKPKGRKLILTPPPVKVWAEKNKVNLAQPISLKASGPEIVKHSVFNNRRPELFVVASYGKIIPQGILEIPTRGTLNVHPSLLPKYRGPSPIQTAILNGDQETGVTIMLLDEEVDHGAIVAQESFQITSDKLQENTDTYLELRDKLAQIGGALLTKTIPDWVSGKIEAKEQDHDAATFTKIIEKENGKITLEDIENKPEETYRKFLAYILWPGLYFFDQQGKRIKITAASFQNAKLTIEKIIPEDKSEMTWKAYKLGR